MMNTYTKTISPQEAQRLLDHDHVNNRHISSSTVRHYARQMEEGLWNEDNPQPIILTRDGLLLDGQHRLTAVVESGKPTRFTFAIVPDDSTFEYLDQGKARTPADFIQAPNATTQASIAKTAYCIRFGNAGITGCLNGRLEDSKNNGINCSREETLKEWQDEQTIIMQCTAYARKMRAEIKKGSFKVYGSFVYLLHYLKQDQMILDFIDDFLRQQPKRSATQATKDFIRGVYMDGRKAGHNRDFSVFFGLWTGYQKFCSNVTIKNFSVASKTSEKINREIRQMRSNYAYGGLCFQPLQGGTEC